MTTEIYEEYYSTWQNSQTIEKYNTTKSLNNKYTITYV